MGPDLDFTLWWASKSEEFEWKNHPLHKVLVASAAPEDHHPIGVVAIGAIPQLPLHR